MSVNSILEQVATTSSKNEKIAILSSHKNNKDLKEVIRLAYDPTINFYIKQIPEVENHAGVLTLNTSLGMLNQLSSRQLTGNSARVYLKQILESLSKEDASVVTRIVSRDLRAGFSDSTSNKVWKNLIPDYPYMRCSLPKAVKIEEFFEDGGAYSQLKADGMFANVNHELNGAVLITSRSGSEFPLDEFDDLVTEVKDTLPQGTQTHGEFLVIRNGETLPRQISNGILNSVLKGGAFGENEYPVYLVWDNIPLTSVVSKGSYATPYKTRCANLFRSIRDKKFIKPIPTRIVKNMEDALEHYREQLDAGLEGTILKKANGIWKDGTSKEQVKMKLDVDVDLKITGFTTGKGKNEDLFGSIMGETSDGLLKVCASGITDDMRALIHENRESLIDTIMTVKSNSIMPPTKSNPFYSFFLPRVVELRQDKKEADSLERVKEQFDNAIKG